MQYTVKLHANIILSAVLDYQSDIRLLLRDILDSLEATQAMQNLRRLIDLLYGSCSSEFPPATLN